MPMVHVDARGKPCPQPVVMAKAAIDQGISELEVRVDNDISAHNVARFLASQGFATSQSGEGADLVVGGRREHTPATGNQRAVAVTENPLRGEDVGVLILDHTMGRESVELGEALIKAFLGTLAGRTPLPVVVALMNGGVLLALREHSASEVLGEMASQGCRVLVCGTCVKHFGIADRVAVGTISNMFEITDALLHTHRQLTLG